MAIRYELNADKMMSAIISLPEPDKTVTDVQLILSNEKELVIGTKKSFMIKMGRYVLRQKSRQRNGKKR